MAHTLGVVFLSQPKQIYLLPIAVSLTECFARRYQQLELL